MQINNIITERVITYYNRCLLTCSHADEIKANGDIVFACFTMGAPDFLEKTHTSRTITKLDFMSHLRSDKRRCIWFTNPNDVQELESFAFDDWYDEMLENNKVGLCDIAEDIINHKEGRRGFFNPRIFALETPCQKDWNVEVLE